MTTFKCGHPRNEDNSTKRGRCRTCDNEYQRQRYKARKKPGVGLGVRNRRKTHCPQGHAYDSENTYVTPSGYRQCKECQRKNYKKWYSENRDEWCGKRRSRYALDEDYRQQILNANRDWAKANPDKINGISRVKKHRRRAAGELSVRDWREVLDVFGETCLACGDVNQMVTIDHIVPVSKGGTNSIDNLQPLCGSCNSSKADKTVDYRSPWQRCLIR